MKEIIKNDFSIKIFCLIFAFFAWLYIMSDLDPVDTRDISGVEVKITNEKEINEKNLVLSPNQNLKANVKIKARRSILTKKVREGVNLSATITEPKIGVNKANIQNITNTNDITYIVAPSTLEVILEENKVKSEKVYIKSTGNLASNTSIDIVKLSKDRVFVSGPSSLIDKLYRVEAEIDLSDKATDFTKMSKLNFIDHNGQVIQGLYAMDDSIMITVKVKKQKIVSITPSVNDDEGSYNLGNIKIEPKAVKIEGSPADVDKINTIITRPLNMSEIVLKKSLDTMLVVPPNISISPNSVKITFLGYVRQGENRVQNNEEANKNQENNTQQNSTENNVKTLKDYNFQYNTEEIDTSAVDENIIKDLNIPEKIEVSIKSDDNITKNDIKLFLEEADKESKKIVIKYKTDKNVESVTILPNSI